MRNRKKRLYSKAKRACKTSVYQNYSACLKMYSSALGKAKDKCFSNGLPEILKSNPAKFWKVIIHGTASNRVSLHNSSDILLLGRGCSLAFNSFFSSVFTREDTSSLPCFPELSYQYMEPAEIATEGISLITQP